MKSVLLAAAVAGIALGVPITATAQQALGMGAGAQGSQNYAVNGALTGFLSERLGLDLRLQSFGGSGASMPLINNGRLDLQGIVSPDVLAGALALEPFEGMPQMENLRLIAALGPSFYGFFVNADSPHRSVSDIAGERITYGYTAQPTLRLQVDGILANGGLTPDQMEQVLVPSVPRGADDFIAGQADVVFFAMRAGKVQEADAAVGIRWLQLSTDPEAEAAMQRWTPGSYVQVVEPGPGILGMTEPTAMMAYDYWLVAGAHVSDDVIYDITRTLAENTTDVQGLLGTLSGFTTDVMVPADPGIPYHAGAERFYREAGLWSQD